MLKPGTHFKQVSLETVRKIVEEQVRTQTTAKKQQATRKVLLKKGLLAAGKQSLAISPTYPQVE